MPLECSVNVVGVPVRVTDGASSQTGVSTKMGTISCTVIRYLNMWFGGTALASIDALWNCRDLDWINSQGITFGLRW